MLDVIEEYSFSSIACHQAILVLDFFKQSFDEDDLATLKEFVQRNLNERTYLTFETGNRTTNPHLAAIIKMALVLKKLTFDEEPEEISSDDSNKSAHKKPKPEPKKCDDEEWQTFCQGNLKVFETKWTKRLEDYGPDPEPLFRFKTNVKDDESKRIKGNEESETAIKSMLEAGNLNRRIIEGRNKQQNKKSNEKKDASNDKISEEEE